MRPRPVRSHRDARTAVVVVVLAAFTLLTVVSATGLPRAPAARGSLMPRALAVAAAPAVPHPHNATLYTVTFTESGAPGNSWGVELNNGASDGGGGVSSLPFSLPNGSYRYTIDYEGNSVPSPPNGGFTVAGAPQTIPIQYSVPTLYPVTFVASGLRPGTSWGFKVTWQDSSWYSITQRPTANNSTVYLRNDSYTFGVGGARGYAADTAPGGFALSGAPMTVPIRYHFGRVDISFEEVGLPVGTVWNVTLGNSTNVTNTTNLVAHGNNGTLAYAVGQVGPFNPNPRSGFVNFSQGPATIPLNFSRPGYDLVLQEVGLPAGHYWTASVNGTPASSSGTQIVVVEPNGTYPYRVGGVPGFRADRYAGTVNIDGGSAEGAITWSPTLYNVTFEESGLAAGTVWQIGLGNASGTSSTAGIDLAVPNGTFSVHAFQVAGYSENVTANVTVGGGNATVSVVFTALPASGFSIAGLSSTESWAVVLVPVVAVVGVAAYAVVRRRRPAT